MEKDTGSWLSAQQAVLPDGTELTNLPLVNKKLPPLSHPENSASAMEDEQTDDKGGNVGDQI
ncbi:MAG: hypothetical protein JO002_13635 [Burkholderiaceae bacterium]|nr:hypothetical protein [Burkholderiaceae bacterium]